ncbi:hypothetical protein CVT26_007853 [Gymnopilus dilepis]|uniref:Uncharacterized protein n=1 Tax=Gymnopilus dilepis TaxID=231916 RepID=A0A409YK24_9AGAR|nr:hypothetical protein CVT26_007853 [Gymnopilus dilepis]
MPSAHLPEQRDGDGDNDDHEQGLTDKKTHLRLTLLREGDGMVLSKGLGTIRPHFAIAWRGG